MVKLHIYRYVIHKTTGVGFMYKRIMSVLICAALVVTGTAVLPASAYAAGGSDAGAVRGAIYLRGNKSTEAIDTFYYSDDLFKGDSRKYNSSLATFSCYTTGAALTSERTDTKGEGYLSKSRNIRALLEDIGFTDIELSKAYTEPIYDEDSVAVACAHKKITDKGKDYTLLAIIPRSGSYDKEFGSRACETRAAPMAVSDTALNPSLYRALTKLSSTPANSETYDGASETMTFFFERKAILTWSTSSRMVFTLFGHSLTQVPQKVQRSWSMTARASFICMALTGQCLTHL